MTRLWVNRTYATSFHSLLLLRAQADLQDLVILGSHADPSSPVLTACDATFPEPQLEGDDYAQFALEFCVRHGVDAFWPTYQAAAVSRRSGEFAAHGTRTLVSPPQAMEAVEDKALTYRISATAAVPGLRIPPHVVVRTADEFVRACERLSDLGPLCFKPVRGTGGTGFHVLAGAESWQDLFEERPPTMTLDRAYQLLARAEAFEPLLVMPFLEGPEVSVDCLSKDGELLVAVARQKCDQSRRIELLDAPDVVEVARQVVQLFGLSYLSNVQLRYWGKEPCLLEVNARASGGLFQSCLSGVNFPHLALRLLLDGAVTAPVPTLPVSLTTLNSAVELRERSRLQEK